MPPCERWDSGSCGCVPWPGSARWLTVATLMSSLVTRRPAAGEPGPEPPHYPASSFTQVKPPVR